ncbi:MAG TPA: type III pantothenate kinase [Rhabdochlamydiaceae bacterium]|nr:type III pantothenate kinase [Rhabdochlamydiaceae bacterium]
MTDLVIDIGNFRVKGAFFEQENIVGRFVFPVEKLPFDSLKSVLKSRPFKYALIASVNAPVEEKVKALFSEEKWPFKKLHFKEIKAKLEVDEPEEVGLDRIANIYGALYHFPQNDCIVVDIGTAVTFDFIKKEGIYLGGAIYPGPEIGAKALAEFTDKLPLVPVQKPPEPIAKTTVTHIQSGLYWGLLGAIERIVDEMRLEQPSPSSIKILATGGKTRPDEAHADPSHNEFIEDLKELVEFIDPDLTLRGLNEIVKELKKGV